jgi:hypothetical protein
MTYHVSVGSALFIIGGIDGPSASDKLVRYAPPTSSVSTLPFLRYGGCAVVRHSFVYLLGGWKVISGSATMASDYLLNRDIEASPSNWISATVPFTLQLPAAGTFPHSWGDDIVVVGGQSATDYLNSLWIARARDINNDTGSIATWSNIATDFYTVGSNAVFNPYSNEIIFLGRPSLGSNLIYLYRLASDYTWTYGSYNWPLRFRAGVQMVRNSILVFGGMAADGSALGDIWISKDYVSWSVLAISPSFGPKYGFASGVVNGALFIVGGNSTNAPEESFLAPLFTSSVRLAASASTDMFFMSFDTSLVQCIYQFGCYSLDFGSSLPTPITSSLPSPRSAGAVVQVANYTVLVGGTDGTSSLADSWIAPRNSASFVQFSAFAARQDHCLVAVDDVVYALGGKSGSVVFNDVFKVSIHALAGSTPKTGLFFCFCSSSIKPFLNSFLFVPRFQLTPLLLGPWLPMQPHGPRDATLLPSCSMVNWSSVLVKIPTLSMICGRPPPGPPAPGSPGPWRLSRPSQLAITLVLPFTRIRLTSSVVLTLHSTRLSTTSTTALTRSSGLLSLSVLLSLLVLDLLWSLSTMACTFWVVPSTMFSRLHPMC